MKKSFGEREKLIESIKERPFGLVSLSDELKNDREIVLAAINKDVYSLDNYASDELRNDREMVLAAVNKDGAYLRYVSDEFKNDREIVTAAISKEPSAIKYASEKLQIEFDQ